MTKHFHPLETRSAVPLETRDDDGTGGLEQAIAAVTELRTAATAFETRITDQLTAVTARLDEEEARRQRPGNQTPDNGPSAETRAFGTYLRLGNAAPAEELRTLQVGIDPQGGYLAPAEMSTEFIRDLTEFSPIRGLATVRQTASPSVIYPRRTSATSALWKGELQAAGASEPAFGQVEIPTKELNTYVDVSNQLLADSAGQAEAEVRLALAEDFGKKEGTAFVSGNGALEPEGLLTNADVGYEASGNASSLGSAPADLLITTMYALPAAYRSRGTWLMNGATLASIRKLKDGQGNFLWQPSYVAGQPEMILGRPVVEAPDMPDIGTSKEPIVFGDIASAYRIVDRLALSILVNPYLLATSGITRIHATRRVGAAVVKAAALRKVRCAVS